MRALLVEDNRELATMIRATLAREGFAVDHAETAAAADDCLAVASFDLAILDLGLPDGDGIDLLARWRRAGRNLPVLIVTARGGLGDRIGGLDAGGDDYLVKPFATGELLARCRALLRRPGAALGTVLTCGDLTLDSAGRIAAVGGVNLGLSRRELDLLTLLMRRQGNVVAKEAIESALYSFDEPVTPNAVEALISRLRKRLGEAGGRAGIVTVRGLGYMLREEAA